MTAEIAILNKSAVALAADSAVTISAGSKEEKIFDSADKLFELSDHDPIGVMIYNGMSFMEAPLPSLIRQFRASCPAVNRVEESATAFLTFLSEFGRRAPQSVKDASIDAIVEPVIANIERRYLEKLQKQLFEGGIKADNFEEVAKGLLDREIDVFFRVLERSKDAEFIGGAVRIKPKQIEQLRKIIDSTFARVSEDQKGKLLDVAKMALIKGALSRGLTGIVVAGFGKDDLFPTLLSFEIDGVVCDRLKYIRSHNVDIDRRGTRAKVIPFAQKEMVERFLYGLDESSQRKITTFCKETMPVIRQGILDTLNLPQDTDKTAIETKVRQAEDAFLDGLKTKAFEEIRSLSQAEIEDMVEFMPKPELAKMAEALVNLTSIKRRVSRGMETVAGPIDVAVISQSEGFVWVKRKHYFPQELNSRYFNRVRRMMGVSQRETPHDGPQKPRSTSPRGRGKAPPPQRRGARRKRPK